MPDDLVRPDGPPPEIAPPDSPWWPWLRRPFPPNAQGKLTKSKTNRQAPRCDICGANHDNPGGGVHVDYIGHAFLRERLNEVPWSWTPYLTGAGEPMVVQEKDEAWMPFRITVMGVVREEVAVCPLSKSEWPKVLWSDVITRGAMAHGVGLELWQKDMPVDSDRSSGSRGGSEPPPGPSTDEMVQECRTLVSGLSERLRPTWESWKAEEELPEFPKGARPTKIAEALTFLKDLAESERP